MHIVYKLLIFLFFLPTVKASIRFYLKYFGMIRNLSQLSCTITKYLSTKLINRKGKWLLLFSLLSKPTVWTKPYCF